MEVIAIQFDYKVLGHTAYIMYSIVLQSKTEIYRGPIYPDNRFTGVKTFPPTIPVNWLPTVCMIFTV